MSLGSGSLRRYRGVTDLIGSQDGDPLISKPDPLVDVSIVVSGVP